MSRITRRQALTAAAGAAAGLAVAGAADAVAKTADASTGRAPKPAAEPASFDEVYQGRRIQGSTSGGGGHHGGHGGGPRARRRRGTARDAQRRRNLDQRRQPLRDVHDPTAAACAAVRELQGAASWPLAPP